MEKNRNIENFIEQILNKINSEQAKEIIKKQPTLDNSYIFIREFEGIQAYGLIQKEHIHLYADDWCEEELLKLKE